MDSKRAERRAAERRMKARARRVMKLWFRYNGRRTDDPRAIGVNASTHCSR